MEAIIDLIGDNPLYGIGLAALLLFLAFALFKRMFKIVILAIILNVAYVYYLQDMANDVVARTTDKAGDLIDQAGSLFK